MRPALLDPLPLADRVRTARRPGVCTICRAPISIGQRIAHLHHHRKDGSTMTDPPLALRPGQADWETEMWARAPCRVRRRRHTAASTAARAARHRRRVARRHARIARRGGRMVNEAQRAKWKAAIAAHRRAQRRGRHRRLKPITGYVIKPLGSPLSVKPQGHLHCPDSDQGTFGE